MIILSLAVGIPLLNFRAYYSLLYINTTLEFYEYTSNFNTGFRCCFVCFFSSMNLDKLNITDI